MDSLESETLPPMKTTQESIDVASIVSDEATISTNGGAPPRANYSGEPVPPKLVESSNTLDHNSAPPLQVDSPVIQALAATPTTGDAAVIDAVAKPAASVAFPSVKFATGSSPSSTQQLGSTEVAPNAWSKPSSLTAPPNAVTILMQTSKDLIADLSKETQWPSLSAARAAPSKRRHLDSRVSNATQSLHSDRCHAAGPFMRTQQAWENDPEYPWASKMEKSKRNLHKVTSPVFLEDGTPKVCIPREVLLEGLENQREFVLGQFYRCSAPAPGLIQSVVSRIWGTRCRIYTRDLGNNSFLFHIPDEPTRKWVTQRGMWHVDDCLMFVSTWNPKGTISLPAISTIPVWLTLKDIPHQLYSKKGISWIASGIGAPMLTSRPWLDPILMGEAKILVEVKLDRPFPQRVALEDESGSISMVSVIYSWLPSVCSKCGQLGHKAPRCLGLPPIPISKVTHLSAPNSGTEIQMPANKKSTAAPSFTAASTLSLGHKDGPESISIDPQGCILLDHEGSEFGTSNKAPVTAARSDVVLDMNKSNSEVVNTSSAIKEVENIPTVSEENASHDAAENDYIYNKSDFVAQDTPISNEKELPASPILATSTSEGTQQLSSSKDKDKGVSNCPTGPLVTPQQFEEKNPFGILATCEEIDLPYAVPLAQDNTLATLNSDGVTNPPDTPSNPGTTLLATTSVSSDSSPRLINDPLVDFNHGTFPPQVTGPSSSPSYSSVMSGYENLDVLIQRSRGGRYIKPSIKAQEMGWSTVGGKGRRGRGGRGGGGRGDHDPPH